MRIFQSFDSGFILIGQFDPLSDKEVLNKLIKKNINIFSLNLLPRITRAQSMDILSSQANLAGYRAVIESVEEFDKATIEVYCSGTTRTRILKVVSNCTLGTHLKSELLALKLTY